MRMYGLTVLPYCGTCQRFAAALLQQTSQDPRLSEKPRNVCHCKAGHEHNQMHACKCNSGVCFRQASKRASTANTGRSKVPGHLAIPLLVGTPVRAIGPGGLCATAGSRFGRITLCLEQELTRLLLLQSPKRIAEPTLGSVAADLLFGVLAMGVPKSLQPILVGIPIKHSATPWPSWGKRASHIFIMCGGAWTGDIQVDLWLI